MNIIIEVLKRNKNNKRRAIFWLLSKDANSEYWYRIYQIFVFICALTNLVTNSLELICVTQLNINMIFNQKTKAII